MNIPIKICSNIFRFALFVGASAATISAQKPNVPGAKQVVDNVGRYALADDRTRRDRRVSPLDFSFGVECLLRAIPLPAVTTAGEADVDLPMLRTTMLTRRWNLSGFERRFVRLHLKPAPAPGQTDPFQKEVLNGPESSGVGRCRTLAPGNFRSG